MVGHISPLMTLTHIILRRISPAFWLTARDISPVMDIRYDEQRDIILPFLKNLVKTRTNFTEWWNEYMKLWDIFLPSWNELTSYWDKGEEKIPVSVTLMSIFSSFFSTFLVKLSSTICCLILEASVFLKKHSKFFPLSS